jgi:hypothetical protein
MVAIIPVRQYQTSHCELNNNNEIIADLDWPCYDVFGFDGKSKDVIRDVPNCRVKEAIDILRERNPRIGVLGVAELGVNRADAEFLAEHGIGIH